ncbi:hypothetical protein SEEM841_03202 [Salmonella enterica subsp. enterica serovar Senftenberg str. 423984-1]|nr:hypothetical protein SEEM841_03202 [Salmonella enterica subsp. enterica serovar Senftenberg str. 423984-1]
MPWKKYYHYLMTKMSLQYVADSFLIMMLILLLYTQEILIMVPKL